MALATCDCHFQFVQHVGGNRYTQKDVGIELNNLAYMFSHLFLGGSPGDVSEEQVT